MSNERELFIVQRNNDSTEITHKVVHADDHIRVEISLADFIAHLSREMGGAPVESFGIRLIRKIIGKWYPNQFIELTPEKVSAKMTHHAQAVITSMKQSTIRVPPRNNRKS